MSLHNRLAKIEKNQPKVTPPSRCNRCHQGGTAGSNIPHEQEQKIICDTEMRETLIDAADAAGEIRSKYEQVKCPDCSAWWWPGLPDTEREQISAIYKNAQCKIQQMWKERGWGDIW